MKDKELREIVHDLVKELIRQNALREITTSEKHVVNRALNLKKVQVKEEY